MYPSTPLRDLFVLINENQEERMKFLLDPVGYCKKHGVTIPDGMASEVNALSNELYTWIPGLATKPLQYQHVVAHIKNHDTPKDTPDEEMLIL